jgi:hypothetical protein
METRIQLPAQTALLRKKTPRPLSERHAAWWATSSKGDIPALKGSQTQLGKER